MTDARSPTGSCHQRSHNRKTSLHSAVLSLFHHGGGSDATTATKSAPVPQSEWHKSPSSSPTLISRAKIHAKHRRTQSASVEGTTRASQTPVKQKKHGSSRHPPPPPLPLLSRRASHKTALPSPPPFPVVESAFPSIALHIRRPSKTSTRGVETVKQATTAGSSDEECCDILDLYLKESPTQTQTYFPFDAGHGLTLGPLGESEDLEYMEYPVDEEEETETDEGDYDDACFREGRRHRQYSALSLSAFPLPPSRTLPPPASPPLQPLPCVSSHTMPDSSRPTSSTITTPRPPQHERTESAESAESECGIPREVVIMAQQKQQQHQQQQQESKGELLPNTPPLTPSVEKPKRQRTSSSSSSAGQREWHEVGGLKLGQAVQEMEKRLLAAETGACSGGRGGEAGAGVDTRRSSESSYGSEVDVEWSSSESESEKNLLQLLRELEV